MYGMIKDALRWVALGGVFVMPVIIPFIVSASMFFPYITGKNFTFRIIVEIIFAAWVLLALLDARYRPRFSWVLAAFALFVVVVGLADVTGANFFKSFWSNFERMEGYLAILHLFVYFLVASTVLNTEKIWNAFWYTTLGTSALVALLGLKQVWSALSAGQYLPRIDATFGNPIYLAVYALFHVFIALIMILRWRGTVWHQVMLGLLAVVHVAVLILTQTRGTALGLLAGITLAAILVALFERNRKVLRYTALGALGAVVVLVGAVFVIKDQSWAPQTPLVGRFTQYDFTGGTIRARFMNWGMAWEGVQERPLLGWGQDNYEYVFSKYYNPDMYAEEPWFDRTHNLIFDWLIAAGFLGLIAYLLIPTALMAHLWAADPEEKATLRRMLTFRGIKRLFTHRDHAFSPTERALWTGLLAAYFVHNLVVFDNILSYIFYASVLAYLHWRLTEHDEPLWKDVSVSRDTVTSVAMPVTLVVLVAVIWYVNVVGINTSRTLLTALMPQRNTPEQVIDLYEKALAYNQLGRQEVREQLAQAAANMVRNPDVSPETKQRMVDLAVSEIEREVERNPESARLRLFLGTLYSNVGQLPQAVVAFEKAVELTPTKQNALFQLGQAYLASGDNEKALDVFKRAYELQPEYEDARKLYALVLVRTGNDKEAVDLLTEKYGTAAIDDERLIGAWADAKRYDIVIQILEKRLETSPDDVQTRVSLAAAYNDSGNTAQALVTLDQLVADFPEYTDQVEEFKRQVMQN